MFNIEKWNSKIGQVLGWEVFCTVRDQRINRETYKESFQSLFGYEPEVDSDAMAFCEAVHDVAKMNGLVETKVCEENGRHSFRIFKKKLMREEKNAKYISGLLVEWDDKEKVITFDDVENKLVDHIRDTFDYYRSTVSDHKFRQNYTNAVKRNAGISLRDTGGIYFMPNVNGNESVVQNLKKLFTNFNNGKLYPIAFEDKGGCEKDVVWDAVSSNIEKTIVEISEKLEDSKKRVCGLETIFEKTMQAKELVSGYSSLLEKAEEAQGLVEKLQELADKACSRIEKLCR